MTHASPQPGDVLAAKYRIERPLGEGGMAVVYAATHLGLGRPVALKFVKAWALAEKELRERFVREAQATFSLRSEHAVRMLDLGELPSGDLFLVMEMLEGKNLAQVLETSGPVSEFDVARYVSQACDALAEAHALGIIHRDLKPANLFLTSTATGKSCIKVLDFGLAKMDSSNSNQPPLTRVATTLGTPKYMAPEQWDRATHVDGRADIFSLGVILFQMLTGKVPHDELPVDERVRMILAGAVPSPRTLRPEVSETMARIVMRCLRPLPEERFATAQQLAEALAQVTPQGIMRAKQNSLNSTGVTAVVSDAVRAQLKNHEAAVVRGTASDVANSVAPNQLAKNQLAKTFVDANPRGEKPSEDQLPAAAPVQRHSDAPPTRMQPAMSSAPATTAPETPEPQGRRNLSQTAPLGLSPFIAMPPSGVVTAQQPQHAPMPAQATPTAANPQMQAPTRQVAQPNITAMSAGVAPPPAPPGSGMVKTLMSAAAPQPFAATAVSPGAMSPAAPGVMQPQLAQPQTPPSYAHMPQMPPPSYGAPPGPYATPGQMPVPNRPMQHTPAERSYPAPPSNPQPQFGYDPRMAPPMSSGQVAAYNPNAPPQSVAHHASFVPQRNKSNNSLGVIIGILAGLAFVAITVFVVVWFFIRPSAPPAPTAPNPTSAAPIIAEPTATATDTTKPKSVAPAHAQTAAAHRAPEEPPPASASSSPAAANATGAVAPSQAAAPAAATPPGTPAVAPAPAPSPPAALAPTQQPTSATPPASASPPKAGPASPSGKPTGKGKPTKTGTDLGF